MILEVPAELEAWMRSVASRNAFVAAMLDLIRRNGGVSLNQLVMLQTERDRSH